MKLGKFDNNRCACHCLHLVVKRGEAASTAFSSVVVKVSRKVEFFRRSPVALKSLKECQTRFSLPANKLKQQVTTRWNSTYEMIDRFIQQKQAIGDYANRNNDFENLTRDEWDILEEGRSLLKPFVIASMKFSASDCSISEVIPTVKWLFHKVESTAVSILSEMKSELMIWLQKEDPQYFGGLEQKPTYSFATFLDPRYKDAFYRQPSTTTEVVRLLSSAVQDLASAQTATVSAANVVRTVASNDCDFNIDDVAAPTVSQGASNSSGILSYSHSMDVIK